MYVARSALAFPSARSFDLLALLAYALPWHSGTCQIVALGAVHESLSMKSSDRCFFAVKTFEDDIQRIAERVSPSVMFST